MALARCPLVIQDEFGNLVNSASVEVRRESDNGLQSIFSDRAGASALGNPFIATDGADAGFHAAGGVYKITATKGAFSRIWRYVGVGLAAETDGLASQLVNDSSVPGASVKDALHALRLSFNVKEFGAIGDGVANDTTAITAANSASGPKFVPSGLYATTLAATALDGPYWGFGQIRTGATNKRAPWFSAIKANAAYTASNEDSPDTAFNGDFTRSLFPVEHRITSAATLTQPTSGYIYSPWAYPHYTYLYNESGHNNGTADNSGRTAAVAYRTKVVHVGQGDSVAYNASVFVNSTRSGSTSFLANPATAIINGEVGGGQAGVYLQGGEFSLHDNGFDSAGIGWVINLDRGNATGAKAAWWAGFRVQSIGAADVNAAFSASGKYDVGLDFTSITTDANKAWAAVKADDRIYLNASSSNGFFATALGDEYIYYNSAATAIDFVMNGSPSLRLTTVTTPVNFMQIQGRETGVAPVMSAQGSDTNIGIIYSSKGTGTHDFRTNNIGPTQFTISDTASAVNNFNATGAATGGAPTLSAVGSDTNIDAKISAKGTGRLQVGTAGMMQANGTVATVLGSLGPAGSNTTVQEWFAVKNSAGTTRYIPCF
jgi:hypothetical protein